MKFIQFQFIKISNIFIYSAEIHLILFSSTNLLARDKEMSSLVLGYWKIRGIAERLRLLLQYCGLSYTQEFYEGEDGGKYWNNQVKPKLMLKNPAATLPYLKDGEKVISESDAIFVYICFRAQRPQLTGRNAEEKVALATAWGVFKDAQAQFVRLCYDPKQNFETSLSKFPNQIKPYLDKFNGLLGERLFMAGELTWVDFGISDFIQILGMLIPDVILGYPNLKAYQERVWSLPQLTKYFQSGRFKYRPVNNYFSYWK